MFSEFFVRRPIVACVISILILILGGVAYRTLPVAQYPQIAPPVIRVTTVFPGASAQVIADTVAAPIEQQVNGVDKMLYMESTSANDGSYTLNVTFEVGTDIDIASVLVQNRVAIALAKLPDDVRRQGVTTNKVSSSIVTVFGLRPSDEQARASYSDLFLANYLLINVNDRIKRITGVGDTLIRPSKDYGMRIWLDPDRLKARSLTSVDVVRALQEQNVQVAAGVIGQPPAPAGLGFQYSVTTLGRLEHPEQFADVIVRADGNRVVRLRDVARVELGAKAYDTLGRIDGVPSALVVVYLSPDGNSVKVAEALHELMAEVQKELPAGIEVVTIYDTSVFVKAAIEEVYKTLLEAVGLVILVVLVFLGGVRSTLIPIAAIPVSLVGTFLAMALFGFSLNLPTLFGLVLAIGIVVDDAIVVVENVERNLTELHLPPKQAAVRAMQEVFGAVLGISLVLMAVFLPTAALPGISGQLYRQFALTIAASTFFSALCALTLSPALAGVLLRAHAEGKKHNLWKRAFDRVFGWVAAGYGGLIRQLLRPVTIAVALLVFLGALAATEFAAREVPTGFVPDEDRGYFITEIWMPDAASQDRTLAVIEKCEKALRETEGINHIAAFQGFSLIAGNGSNYAVMFSGLLPWEERLPHGRTLPVVMGEVRAKYAQIQEGAIIAFQPPAVEGIGSAAGFELRLEDRGGVGRFGLAQVVQELIVDGSQQTGLQRISSPYRAAVPMLYADVDREKVKKRGVSLQDVFSTMSVDLGSAYVNDFNKFGRTWQVNLQADSAFRARASQVKGLQVRNDSGDMIPLGSLLDMHETMGPDHVIRYNLYPAAALQGVPAPGTSTGDAMAIMSSMLEHKRPQGIGNEWTALSFQEQRASGQAAYVFLLALVVVYLILAGLYESWTLPLPVILSIPLAVLGAMYGLLWRGMDNNIYTQVGLVLLVGLGAKNAILIVEFARVLREQGRGLAESAIEAARLRLRPILMTALAFIFGVLPLVHATGAGAASRQAIGTAVFYGMIGNTLLGLFFTPVLYVAVRWVAERVSGRRAQESRGRTEPAPTAQHPQLG
jgi:HAE1 family hydrophobic/amphiphilic exporter-1